MSKYQKGFGAVEAIIIVIVVAIIGFGAWFVWDKNQKDDAKQETTTTTQNNAEANKEEEKPTLTITEWGVKFTLSDPIKDAYYAVEAGKPDYAYLSVHSLTDPECAPDKTSVGAITRFAEGDRDPISDSLYTEVVPDATKLGDYYYFFSHAQAYCDESKETTLKALDTAFDEAVKTVKTVE